MSELVHERPALAEAPKLAERLKGEKYIQNNEVKTWTGTRWHCQHNRIKALCKGCGGKQICPHNKYRSQCKQCGDGTAICSHKRQKAYCKVCLGTGICLHNRRKSDCKECRVRASADSINCDPPVKRSNTTSY